MPGLNEISPATSAPAESKPQAEVSTTNVVSQVETPTSVVSEPVVEQPEPIAQNVVTAKQDPR